MAEEALEVFVSVRVDKRDFDRKMGDVDKRVEETSRKAKRGGLLGGLLGGAVGGFLGAVAGAALTGPESALGSALEGLAGVISAALMPAIVELLVPALTKISDFLTSPEFQAFIRDASAFIKRTVETTGAVAGGVQAAFGEGGALQRQLRDDPVGFLTGANFIRGAVPATLKLFDFLTPGDQSEFWQRKDQPSWFNPSPDGGYVPPINQMGAMPGMG